MMEVPVIQLMSVPRPIDEGDSYLRAQVDEFLDWVSDLTDSGNNTNANMRHWFNQFSQKKKYHSRKKASVRHILLNVLSENPFPNSEMFLEQFK